MMQLSELSASDATAIKALLLQLKPGETCTYEAMSRAIGRDVRQRRHVLHKAMRHLQREHRMVFSTAQNVGVQRLDDSAIVAQAEGALTRVRRASRRASRKLSCANYDALTPEQKLQHNTRMTVLAMVSESTGAAAIKRVGQAVSASQSALPAAKAAIAAMGHIA